MIVTCSLEEEQIEKPGLRAVPKGQGNATGHAVCSHCGGEADIWLDAQ